MHPPIICWPIKPSEYRKYLKLILERNPITVEELAFKIDKSKEWIENELKPDSPGRLENDKKVWEQLILTCIQENKKYYKKFKRFIESNITSSN